MRIVMQRDRWWQDVGREVLLQRGQTYAVPDGVGEAFVATGAAALAPDDEPIAEASIRRSPETKPAFPAETKVGTRTGRT